MLNNFFSYHPNFKYRYFLGDAGFDAIDIYKYLYKEHGMIPIIPHNRRNTKNINKSTIDENEVPTCPNEI